MEKFIEVLADALQMEVSDIHPEDTFRDYEVWDSLAVLSVSASIFSEYGINISRAAYDSFITVKDIYVFVNDNTK